MTLRKHVYRELLSVARKKGPISTIRVLFCSPNKIWRLFINVARDANLKAPILREEVRELLKVLELFSGAPLESFDSLEMREASAITSSTLSQLLSAFGSDKGYLGYSDVYESLFDEILKDKSRKPVLIEIGLGTNNLDIPSNMGIGGKPGASLRAFKAYNERFQLFGGDIDKRILFSEERISTFFVDQLNSETLVTFFSQCPEADLIIDDGLHSPTANLLTFFHSMKAVRPRGYIVIEDIDLSDEVLHLWKLIAALIRKEFWCVIYRCPRSYLFVAKRLAS